MFPDSDHFHSWLSAPVKDHISSLGNFEEEVFFGEFRCFFLLNHLIAPAWTTLPLVSKGLVVPGMFQVQSDLITKAGPEPAASFL